MNLSEFKKKDLKPLSSFSLHSTLNKKVWDDFVIKPKIRKDLIKIAKDFINGLDLDIEIEDIILTGSIANYNYSNYSDYDLHILVDFSKVNKDVTLVKKFFDASRKIWNDSHEIFLEGYNVEVYVQDVSEPHVSSGLFSLLNNKWIVIPEKKNFKIDVNEIKRKAEDIMSQIDDASKSLDEDQIDKIQKKITKLRKDSLNKDGELGIGNLVFKTLRRNDYIKKLLDLKTKAEDKNYENLIEKILKEAKYPE